IREDRSRTDRVLGLSERDEQMDRSSESPHKTNGYGDNDVLNLSKSESRDDLSDSGHAIVTSDRSPDHQDDKDDILSDNDDFDDKNGNTSLGNSNSLLTSVGNISINKNLTESVRSHSNSSNLSSSGTLSNNPLNPLIPNGDDRIPSGLNLSTSLMSLGMGLAAQGVPPNATLPNGAPNSLTAGLVGADRVPISSSSNSDGIVGGPIGSPSTASTPVGISTPHPPLSSLENLLGNIQNLLKVAAESVRHEEKQWFREKEHLRIEFMRQKEIRERLEKQLVEDEKLKGMYLS
ncbi:Dachshund-like protein 1, partial [Armadillidium vulgare]